MLYINKDIYFINKTKNLKITEVQEKVSVTISYIGLDPC